MNDSRTEKPGLIGQTLDGRYELLEEIGRGGMGVIYRARHVALGKLVAIKVLGATRGKALARFEREARAAARIGHANIVKVTDFGKSDAGEAFIVMELLVGQDLRQAVVAEGTLDAQHILKIARQTLAALAAAHAAGIVHRDLKSQNIFLARQEGEDGDDEEVVKLLDFGISKLLVAADISDDEALTTTGVLMGTPAYLSPEQAHGHSDIDARADIYSFGVVLYEMLTGELPFRGSALDVMMKHANETPPPPRLRRPDLAIPPEIERIVLKAMRKRPEERYASASQMLAAIDDDVLDAAAIDTARPTEAMPLEASTTRNTWIAVATVVVVATVVALLALPSEQPAARDASTAATLPADSAPPRDHFAPLAVDAATVATVAVDASTDLTAHYTLEVRASPGSAKIFIDGKRVGTGRAESTARGTVRLRVTATGHHTWRRELRLDANRSVRVKLKKKPSTSDDDDLEENPYSR